MKVELLVNLKYGSNKIRGKGEVFTDPFPSEIQSEIRLNRGTVRIIEDSAPVNVSDPQKDKEKIKKIVVKRSR
jgi:hypothetical protein